jgi:cellulose synthase/poly-beta-1,6-N-acetylglucosamine synthase-like glycosyltransferase
VTVSVGIPAYNEEKTISQLLQSILKESDRRPHLKEIIVNSSGSTDNTDASVQAMMRTDPRIKLISNARRRGKAIALDSILRVAQGDLVVFIDGDVTLEEHAISTLAHPFLSDDKIGICTGNTMPIKNGNSFFEFASLVVRSLHHELCSYLVSKGKTPKVNGTFYAIRRKILDAFPSNVVSDDEYASWQAQKKGYCIVYVPEAMVYTSDPHTFASFIKWQKRIIAGQMLMKRNFNYDVPTMRASVVAPCLLKLVRRYKRKLLGLSALFSLGALSYLLAFVTFLRNEIPYRY